MSVLITGYPYVRKNFSDTFASQEDVLFLLPKVWKAKDGKVVFYPPKSDKVRTVGAYFFHSAYPLIGGLLKGFMPAFPLRLWEFKNVRVVYSATEPILLSTLYQAFWSKLFGKKHIFFTWENVSYKKFSGLNYWIKILILKATIVFSDGLICGNERAKLIHQEFTNKPIAVIPLSGVDTNFFKPQSQGKQFSGKDLSGKIVFSFVGAIGKRKGIHNAIEAFSRLIKEVENIFIIIAGSGEFENEIDKLIEDRDIKNYLRIPWVSHDDLIKLLNVSDVFLYPSLPLGGWEEQFGYSIAEASACELPIISTNSGSISEIVENNVTGILVKPDDTEGLYQAMKLLTEDSSKRQAMGQAGRQRIVNLFSYTVVGNKFKDFFNQIING